MAMPSLHEEITERHSLAADDDATRKEVIYYMLL